MDFKKIDNKYRFVPFWSWNEKLSTDETARQIDVMEKAGIGGFIMHARGGLETAYMGDEWFRNISVGIDEAKERGMKAWAYDENGWPSGFGAGIISGKGLDFQQKFLRMESGAPTNDRTIVYKDGYHFYYDVNPYYVDLMNPEVTKAFIKEIYEPYYEKYKNSFEGFFTDEPQLAHTGNGLCIPWSFILPAEYKKEYGEELLEKLIELFRPVGNYEDTRIKFWLLVTKLFSENFMHTIYNWCDERSLKLTGHLLCEEELISQLVSCGSTMPAYEYFHMPGMDWLGRNVRECLTPLQVSSVAHQLGKKEILSETFALCGHNVSFDELKHITQHQMARGITRICPHLEGYSIRGLRKRDYPPAMYFQQPWWEEYPGFTETVSRVGMILSEGSVKFDTLLLHNQTTAWALYDANDDCKPRIKEYNDALLEAIRVLEKKHIPFHLGDEIILSRHAHIEDGFFVVGTQRYKNVVLPPNKHLLKSTVQLLNEFEHAGGCITTADKLPENDICENEDLWYTVRELDGCKIHYFANSTDKEFTANITHGSKMINLETGDVLPFYGIYKFHAYESIMVIDDGSAAPSRPFKKQPKILDISGEWEVSDFGDNALTLDTCTVYFDGELVGENINAPDVIHMALALKRNVLIKCDYTFEVRAVPDRIKLVFETPEKFTVSLNGAPLTSSDKGYFIDKSMRVFDIAPLVNEGTNTISLTTDYTPSPQLLSSLSKALSFEGEKNKLCFDTETEAVYIIGNFSVMNDGGFVQLDKNAVRSKGSFYIDKPKKFVSAANLEQQGFAFFAGRLTLKKKFNLSDAGYALSFNKKGVNAVNVKVNGKSAGSVLWAPNECDLSDYLTKGDNTIEITLVNNLRNLLGPHHLPIGESYTVCPRDFYKAPCVWNGMKPTPWNDCYCLVEFGIE